MKRSAIRSTSCCGSLRSRASGVGFAVGAGRQGWGWQSSDSGDFYGDPGLNSTFMRGIDLKLPHPRTRSAQTVRAPPARSRETSVDATTASSTSTTRRCRVASATYFTVRAKCCPKLATRKSCATPVASQDRGPHQLFDPTARAGDIQLNRIIPARCAI